MLESASQADGHAEVLEHYVAMPTRMLAEEHLGRLASQNMLATAYQADGQVKKPGARRRGGHKGAWRQPPFPTYIAGEIFVIHTSEMVQWLACGRASYCPTKVNEGDFYPRGFFLLLYLEVAYMDRKGPHGR